MLADTKSVVLEGYIARVLLIFFQKGSQLLQVLLLVDLHLFPKRNCIGVPLGVLDVITLDTPKAFVLLNVLLHQIIDVIILHMT